MMRFREIKVFIYFFPFFFREIIIQHFQTAVHAISQRVCLVGHKLTFQAHPRFNRVIPVEGKILRVYPDIHAPLVGKPERG